MIPAPSPIPPASYRFENVQLLPVERRLLIDGGVTAVGARAFDVLLALVERRERVVTRAELLDLCWPDADVEPNNIAVQIGTLRRILGRQVIASIPGRGYRFSAVVRAQPAEGATAVVASAHRTNIPELGTLVGRDDDFRVVSELLYANRLVTILGAGGIGKSRLALHVLDAKRDAYRHGVCWVELGAIVDAASLPAAIAGALGIIGIASSTALEAAIAPLEILIALDNAEHLIDGVGGLAEAILRSAPGARLLVTSQAPIRLPQEQLYRVGPLAMPTGLANVEQALAFGAVTLFVQRARAADARFELDEHNVGAVVDLCRQLDGLPLAIELAAARVRLLGVEQVAASMHQRLQVLTGGFRNAPARQQTLAAALEWSHQLLTASERIVFRRLAAVADSASFELVQAIATDVDHATPDADGPLDASVVVAALANLVDRSLVATVISPSAPQRRRYRLLEIARAYAAERLAAAGEIELVAARHAKAMAALMAQAWIDRWSGSVGYRAWIDRLDADVLNSRAAYAWARRQHAVDLALALAPVVLNRVLPGAVPAERLVVAEWLAQVLAALPAARDQLPARNALMRFWNERDVQRSIAETAATLALAEACGDRFAAYYARSWQVRLFVQTRDIDAAVAALAQMDALEDPTWPAMRLWIGAEARSLHPALIAKGTTQVEVVKRELELVRLAGDNGHVTAGNLMDALTLAGNPAESATLGWQLLKELESTRNDFGRLVVRISMLAALLALCDTEGARPVAQAAWRSARHFLLHGDCADHVGLLAALEQRWAAAAALVGYADNVYAGRGSQRWRTEAHAHEESSRLARAAMGDDAFERARAEGERLSDIEVETIAFAHP